MNKSKRLYFLISEGLRVLSKLIKWYQYGYEFTHAALVTNMDNIHNPEVIAAVHTIKKGQFWDVHSKVPQKKFKYYYVEVTDQEYKDIMEWAELTVNSKYDVTGLFSFILRKDKNKVDRYFCSELVFECLFNSGVKILNNVLPYEVSPKMLVTSPLVKEDKELNNKVNNFIKELDNRLNNFV